MVNLGCFLFLFFATSPTYILTNMRVIYALKNLTKLLNIGDQINDFLPTMLLYTLATLLPILVAYSDWLLGHWRRSAENLWIMRKVKAMQGKFMLKMSISGQTNALHGVICNLHPVFFRSSFTFCFLC